MNLNQSYLEKLKKQFEEHDKSIEYYQELISPKIIKFKWATHSQAHLQLYYNERSRVPKGKIYDEQKSSTCYKIGYDEQQRIIYEEDEHQYRKFIIYGEKEATAYIFSGQKFDEIEFQEFEKSTVYLFASYAKGKVQTVDIYKYLALKVLNIESYHSYEAFGYPPQTPIYRIGHNSLDDLSIIRRIDEPSNHFPKGQDIIIYQKPKYTLKALFDKMIKLCTTEIKLRLLLFNKTYDEGYLLIALNQVFNSDDWLPPRVIFIKDTQALKGDVPLNEFIDFESRDVFFDTIRRMKEGIELKTGDFSTDFEAGEPFDVILHSSMMWKLSEMLMQEIEIKEKYDLPLKLIIKIAKELKAFIKKQYQNKVKILVLDLPDDFYSDMNYILSRVYSKREIKQFLKENN